MSARVVRALVGLLCVSLSAASVVVAVQCTDGALVGTDSSSSLGAASALVQNRMFTSVFPLDDSLVLCHVAGSSEFYRLLDDAQMELMQFKAEHDSIGSPSMTAEVMAGKLRRLIYSKFRSVHAILVGRSKAKFSVFELLPGGSLIEQRVVAGGSGADSALALAEVLLETPGSMEQTATSMRKLLQHVTGQDHRSRGPLRIWAIGTQGLKELR